MDYYSTTYTARNELTKYTIRTFLQYIESGKLSLDAAYQRNLVWHATEKSGYIDSILRGYIPNQIVLVVIDRASGKEEVLDGKQRLHSIQAFAKGELAVHPTGKALTFGALSQLDQSRFLDTQLQVVLMDRDQYSEIMLQDVFYRISMGKKLTQAELLNSMVHKEMIRVLRRVKDNFRQKFTRTKRLRLHDRRKELLPKLIQGYCAFTSALAAPPFATPAARTRQVLEEEYDPDRMSRFVAALYDTAEALTCGTSWAHFLLLVLATRQNGNPKRNVKAFARFVEGKAAKRQQELWSGLANKTGVTAMNEKWAILRSAIDGRSVPKGLREQLWRREFGGTSTGTCVACRKATITSFNFEAAHVRAYAAGGATVLDNLRPTCRQCNRDCGTMDLDRFIREYHSDAKISAQDTKKNS